MIDKEVDKSLCVDGRDLVQVILVLQNYTSSLIECRCKRCRGRLEGSLMQTHSCLYFRDEQRGQKTLELGLAFGSKSASVSQLRACGHRLAC